MLNLVHTRQPAGKAIWS